MEKKQNLKGHNTIQGRSSYIFALRCDTDTICGKSITVIFSSSSIYRKRSQIVSQRQKPQKMTCNEKNVVLYLMIMLTSAHRLLKHTMMLNSLKSQ